MTIVDTAPLTANFLISEYAFRKQSSAEEVVAKFNNQYFIMTNNQKREKIEMHQNARRYSKLL